MLVGGHANKNINQETSGDQNNENGDGPARDDERLRHRSEYCLIGARRTT